MDSLDVHRLPQMLLLMRQISGLSHDPDAAGLIGSVARLMEALELFSEVRREVAASSGVAMRQQGEVPEGLEWLMMMPMLMTLQQRSEESAQQPRGLDERALDRLPEVVINTAVMQQLRTHDSEAMCAICHEDYILGQRVLELPCGHFFCGDCGRQWLRRNSSCPVCRTEVCNEEAEGRDNDRSEAHFAQGSPLAAVRRARRNQESRPMELWPPVEDMSRIAGEHSMWGTASQDHESPNEHIQPQRRLEAREEAEDSRDSRTRRDNAGPRSSSRSHVAPRVARASRPDSPINSLQNEARLQNDTTAQEEESASRNPFASRNPHRTPARPSSPLVRNRGQERRSPSRGQDVLLPSLSSSDAPASLGRHASRAATNTHASGNESGTPQQADDISGNDAGSPQRPSGTTAVTPLTAQRAQVRVRRRLGNTQSSIV